MSDTSLLEVTDLRKSFGGIDAVDGITFSIDEGVITGLIGPNGAGKTTLFNLVSGLYRPDSGTIRFKGENLQDIMRPSQKETLIWTSSAGISLGIVGAGMTASAGFALPLVGASTGLGIGSGIGVYFAQEHIKKRYLNYKRSRPFQVSRAGLSRTFQITRELGGMTVEENLMLAPQRQIGESPLNVLFQPSRVTAQEKEIRNQAEEILQLLELEHLRNEPADSLSGGQRKLLELGRVLMIEPDLIMLDEPMAGVNPTLSQNLMDQIENLRQEGYTFLIVEHDMEVIMDLSDTILVMHEGKKLMQGSPEDVKQDERVIDAYLGS